MKADFSLSKDLQTDVDGMSNEAIFDFFLNQPALFSDLSDPNDDRMKRQLCIAVLLSFSLSEIRQFGMAFIDRHQPLKEGCDTRPMWAREWAALLSSGSDEEVVDTLTAWEQEPIRKRISAPIFCMLEPSEVVRIKRMFSAKRSGC